MKYLQADKLDFDPRPQMGKIFAEGFGHHFTAFSKDTTRLAKAFAHIFDLSHFYVAVEGETITAISGCTAGFSPIKFDKKICRRELGFFRGWLAYFILTKHIVNHKFPFDFTPGMGRIEVVGTAVEFRGRGAAFGLLTHIMEVTPYTEYVLEVVDDNAPAIKLYEKLGFEAFMAVKDPNSKQSGINAFVYMKRT